METFNYPSRKSSQDGFSLIELMITMALMVIILGAVFALMRGSMLSSSANYEVTKAQQEARFSQEYINRDLVAAGGGIGSTRQVWLPVAFVQTYLKSVVPVGFKDPSNLNYALMTVLTHDNDVAGGISIPNLNGAPSGNTFLAGSDRLTIISADPDFASVPLNPLPLTDPMPIDSTNTVITLPCVIPFPVAACNQMVTTDPLFFPGGVIDGQIYYVSSGASAAFVQLTSHTSTTMSFAAPGGLGLNDNSVTSPFYLMRQPPFNLITIRKMLIINYFVNNNNVLTRRVFGAGTATNAYGRDDTIATNVRGLNFTYSSLPTDDLSVFTAPAAILSTIDESNAVRLVESTIVVGSTPLDTLNTTVIDYPLTTRTNVRNIPFGLAPVPIDVAGNVVPTPTPTPTPTPSPTPTPTPSPTGHED